MKQAKKYLFNNRFTGAVLALTKTQGRKLNEDWSRIKTVTNDKGERVLRMKLDTEVKDKDGVTQMAGITVDISENGERKVVPNGDTDTE